MYIIYFTAGLFAEGSQSWQRTINSNMMLKTADTK